MEDAGEQGEESSDSGKLYISEDALGGRKCSPGDVIKFKVTGKTADGELEIEPEGDGYENSDEQDAMELRHALMAEKMGRS